MDEATTEGNETPKTDLTEATEFIPDDLENIAIELIHGEGGEEIVEYLEHLEGEHVIGEHVTQTKSQEKLGEGEEVVGEHAECAEPEAKGEETPAEVVEEEEEYQPEPPPDPTAPFNFSESKEALKPNFELRPDQLAEVENLWILFQNYTPAYTDIDDYITPKELIFMLKSLLLMTFTAEQFQEVIDWCVRPPHPEGHITYEQFLRIVTIRQRDFLIEDELRDALLVLDPDKTGSIDREEFKELLATEGTKMGSKQLEALIKEVDLSNDGTIGVEDVVGTMFLDLNQEDLILLRNQVYPDNAPKPQGEEDEKETET